FNGDPPMEKKEAEDHVNTPFLKTDADTDEAASAPLSFSYETGPFSDVDQQSSDSAHSDATVDSPASLPSPRQPSPSTPLSAIHPSATIPNNTFQWPPLETPPAKDSKSRPRPKPKKTTVNTHANPASALSKILNLTKTEIPEKSSMPQELR